MPPLGRRETRDLLSRHGLSPRTSLGQHFLVDPNTIRKIVTAAAPGRDEQILEIGAGLGALTIGLVEAGAHVIAVERDRGLAPALNEVVSGRDVVVVWGDALSVDYDRLLDGRPTRVVSNLPYSIATPLVMRLLEERLEISELVVMVQREVGERLAATPGSDAYGAVSAKIAYMAAARVAFRVSRRVFLPEPDVDSVVVALKRLDSAPVEGERSRIFGVIEAGFATRRKTIRNTLRGAGADPPDVERALAAAGVSGGERAERLGLEEFAAIARVLDLPRRGDHVR
ncbi:MAG: 16S rRNA (adenine(1518)-N(6)/adenine(1519)-N(6))-dimethyltransferase RsmA [Actinomycetota bacterium]